MEYGFYLLFFFLMKVRLFFPTQTRLCKEMASGSLFISVFSILYLQFTASTTTYTHTHTYTYNTYTHSLIHPHTYIHFLLWFTFLTSLSLSMWLPSHFSRWIYFVNPRSLNPIAIEQSVYWIIMRLDGLLFINKRNLSLKHIDRDYTWSVEDEGKTVNVYLWIVQQILSRFIALVALTVDHIGGSNTF